MFVLFSVHYDTYALIIKQWQNNTIGIIRVFSNHNVSFNKQFHSSKTRRFIKVK